LVDAWRMAGVELSAAVRIRMAWRVAQRVRAALAALAAVRQRMRRGRAE
jgi:hypothetical protein